MKNRSIKVAIICYIVGLLFYTFDPLLQTFPSVIIDQLMKAFTTTSVGIGIVASSYYYTYNLMQIPAGILSDKYGIKRVLLIALALCFIGITIFALSNSLAMAVGGRMIMGVGGSAAAVILVLISKKYLNIIYLPVLIGIAQFMGNIGSILGQVPISILANKFDWRNSIFMMNIISVLIILLAIIFIKREKLASNPIMEEVKKCAVNLKKVFKNRKNWLIAIYATLVWAPFYTFSSLWGIPFIKEVLSTSTIKASELMAFAWIGSGIGSVLIGIWSTRIDKRKICICASALMGIIVAPILLYLMPKNMIFLSILLFIFGCASAGQSLSFAMIDDVNEGSILGTAVGFSNTVIMMGPMLLDVLIGWFLKINWKGNIGNGVLFYSIHDFKISLSIIPLLFLISLIIGIFYKDQKKGSYAIK